MRPILFFVGSFPIFSFSVFLILAWIVFSFLFWKMLREHGVEEEKIFDLTFYSTIYAFVFARTGFVLSHLDLFRESSIKIVALWVQPGLSLYGALLGGMVTMLFLSRRYKVRVSTVLDSLAFAFPVSFALGTVGSLLDGTVAGTEIGEGSVGIRFAGYPGLRHPIQLYEISALIGIFIVLFFIRRVAQKRSWPHGTVGLWFFLLYSVFMFVLEFFKDSRVYLSGLRANQWLLIGLFGETLGAFYVRGGGREALRPILRLGYRKIREYISTVYAKVSAKFTR
ncbi:MAG: prolipoprotein diacylglyceryl transferase [bacterium]|nr:prolipoprotein diacylglyceryl transferase [bacterium]